MGAGKTSIGRELAERIGREFIDADALIAGTEQASIAELFRDKGEEWFRRTEEEFTAGLLESERAPVVFALGGGALDSERTRATLRTRALTVLLEVDVDTAWERVAGTDRPLAQDEAAFRELHARRESRYREEADVFARDADDVVLAAGGVNVGVGLLQRLGDLVPGDGPVALVSDQRVAGIHGAAAQVALGSRLVSTHTLPSGEDAKSLGAVEGLWRELQLDRGGTVVALGGGCTTDAAGFVAATYMRGVEWVSVPTTLVGQVDAGLGGKTAIDLPEAKNLVGAFHWPATAVVDPALLKTLPGRERRAGLAEVVKTGLLSGERLWELPEPEQVRRCAVYKTEVCLRDPRDRGPRKALNLGHTFAHALEAASDFELAHGEAVALGLLAALRLSGLPTDDVERVLGPKPVPVDPARAWAALTRDKKAEHGRPRLVLLERPGAPRVDVELPEEDIRAALDELIAR